MIKKLKQKFIIINMTIVSFILILVFTAICIISYKNELDFIYKELGASSKIPQEAFPALPPKDIPEKNDIFEGEARFLTVSLVLDKDGKITKTYEGKSESSPTALLEEIAAATLKSDKNEGILKDYSLIYSKHAAPHKTVITYASLSVLSERINTVCTVTGFVLLGCLMLFFILSCALASIAVKPAEKAWNSQKQFIQDASHDLKTPLTVILANNEIMSQHTEECVGENEKWLKSTREEAERMRRLVDSMLELASTDSIEKCEATAEIDISELTERVILQMEPVAFEKYVTIESKIDENIMINADSDSFSRLLHILIDNGIKYSYDRSSIKVTLTQNKRETELSVRNYGTPIAKEDLDHIFERFYRTDKARGHDGFGLGLSIAKNLCEIMGGSITAESSVSEGTAFKVTLPLN